MKKNNCIQTDGGNEDQILLLAGLKRFLINFNKGNVYLEDSVLWYCLEAGPESYLKLPIHQKINFKQSYFDMAL